MSDLLPRATRALVLLVLFTACGSTAGGEPDPSDGRALEPAEAVVAEVEAAEAPAVTEAETETEAEAEAESEAGTEAEAGAEPEDVAPAADPAPAGAGGGVPSLEPSAGAAAASGDAGAAAAFLGGRSEPLLPQPPRPDDPFSGHVTVTEISKEQAQLGRVHFEPFGPCPGTTPEQFAAWTALVGERFRSEADDERIAVVDEQLAALNIVELTPVFINALIGLDMADPADAQVAYDLTDWWYRAQHRYKHVVHSRDTESVEKVAVRNRLIVIDGWVRLWRRTLALPDGVATLKDRVANVENERNWARERQRILYERKRAKEAEAAAGAGADGAGAGADGAGAGADGAGSGGD